MKKKDIIKTKQEFNNIIKQGICLKNKYFVVYFLKNDKPYNRFGISVGKKIGNAVIRNKYKRKIRSIIDIYIKLYTNSNDYIIILRSNALSKSFQELKDSLITLLQEEVQNEHTKKIKN